MSVKLKNGVKTLKLAENDYLHFWYANNRGRGTNNCTIIRSANSTRATKSANQIDVIGKTTTSVWAGNVNFSNRVREALNI